MGDPFQINFSCGFTSKNTTAPLLDNLVLKHRLFTFGKCGGFEPGYWLTPIHPAFFIGAPPFLLGHCPKTRRGVAQAHCTLKPI